MGPDDLIREMAAYYGRRAPWHDKYMSYTDPESMEAQLKPIITRIEPFIVGKDVLEIACGTGNWSRVLAGRARTVWATDINQSVVNIAREKFPDSKNVTFAVADAYDLSSINGSFNAAFAADWFSHIPKSRVELFLESLHKKLNVGSDVVIVDMMPPDKEDAAEISFDDDGNRISRRILPDGSRFQVVKNFPTPQELNYLLHHCGANIEFYEDISLRRWILTYVTR